MEVQPLSGLIDLSGQVAVVTGGAMGIGRACAERLAEAGASVVIVDVNGERAESAAAKIETDGRTAKAIQADLRNAMEGRRVVEEAIEAYGRVDVLVNNAGIYPPVPTFEITEEQWDEVNNLNLKAAFFASQAAAMHMVQNEIAGRIVNLSSLDAITATPHLCHYAASKGGMLAMTKTMALELGAMRPVIRVNAIAPGSTLTEGGRLAGEKFAAQYNTTVDELIAQHSAMHPFGRLATPDHVATVVLFLATELSANITGSTVLVDAGQSLHHA